MTEGDGGTIDAGPADAILVNAGATHPPPLWLDSFWALESFRRIPTATTFAPTLQATSTLMGNLFRARMAIFVCPLPLCIANGARCALSLEPDKIAWEVNTWLYLLKTSFAGSES